MIEFHLIPKIDYIKLKVLSTKRIHKSLILLRGDYGKYMIKNTAVNKTNKHMNSQKKRGKENLHIREIKK